MFTKLDKSSGNILGFKVSGVIKREDYKSLNEEMENVLAEFDSVSILLEFDHFMWELMSAWGKDAKFGMKYAKNIYKMAIVGDRKWQKAMTGLVKPFYAENAEYFHTDEINNAWNWLREG